MFEVSSLFLDNLHLVCRFGKLYGPRRVSTGGMMRDTIRSGWWCQTTLSLTQPSQRMLDLTLLVNIGRWARHTHTHTHMYIYIYTHINYHNHCLFEKNIFFLQLMCGFVRASVPAKSWGYDDVGFVQQLLINLTQRFCVDLGTLVAWVIVNAWWAG